MHSHTLEVTPGTPAVSFSFPADVLIQASWNHTSDNIGFYSLASLSPCGCFLTDFFINKTMITILFIDQNKPDKPAIAAAWVEFLSNGLVAAAVASGQLAPDSDCIDEILQCQGLQWPDTILPVEKFNPFEYDLCVAFCEHSEKVYPALPGNPVLVNWHVPDRKEADSWQQILAQIRALVDDLLHQGYLDALVQARRNGELILGSLSEGIIAHGLDRRFFFFNRAAEEITGLSSENVLGHDCRYIFPEKLCLTDCSFCEKMNIPTLPTAPYQITVRRHDGKDRQVEMSVVPLKNSLDTPIGVVVSMKDVTRERGLARRVGDNDRFAGIISRDARMQEVFRTINVLTNSSVPVFIQGESGVGKELVAVALHRQGHRADRSFVAINCGALPDTLLESELFGHVRGAFSGAIHNKKGRFELADGGTVFLDEIGDISPAMQVKLLRVLQDGTLQRLGDEKTFRVDVRVIAATHRDIKAEIAAGRFREDLYYRLCVVPVHLPPLRERPEDIPLLACHFLKQAAADEKRPGPVLLAQETLNLLKEYQWPGNIRELQNIIRYLLIKCPHDIIEPHYLPTEFGIKHISAVQSAPSGKRRRKLEQNAVRHALRACGNNKTLAARRLGVGRATLYRFLSRWPVA